MITNRLIGVKGLCVIFSARLSVPMLKLNLVLQQLDICLSLAQERQELSSAYDHHLEHQIYAVDYQNLQHQDMQQSLVMDCSCHDL